MHNPGDSLPSKLTEDELTRLRDAVVRLHEGNGGAAQHGSIVATAAALETPGIVTIDFLATRTLGLPMVIVHLGKEPAAKEERFPSLSPRERSVALLIAQGLANKQIAVHLGIALPTVKDHVHRILEKTGLPNRAAVAAATRTNA